MFPSWASSKGRVQARIVAQSPFTPLGSVSGEAIQMLQTLG